MKSFFLLHSYQIKTLPTENLLTNIMINSHKWLLIILKA
jgi:hypothetical protein